MKEKKYKVQGGGEITAASASEFITRLRESSKFDSECTDEEYMENFARRAMIQSGAVIRTDSPELFLQDLQDTGYVS